MKSTLSELFWLASLALLALVTGCGTYRHSRPVLLSVVTEDGRTNIVVASESTSLRVFLQKLDTSALKTSVTDGPYRRTVSLGKLGTAGDADMVNAIAEGVANGITKSQTGGMGIPRTISSTNIIWEQ